MLHVCIFYVDDGQAWGEYIASMLKSKDYEIRVETFDVNKILMKTQKQRDEYKTALLKLLLVTPNFIMALNPPLPCLPNPDEDQNVTALLCSVEAIDLQRVLVCNAWDVLTVTEADDSIRKIIEHVVKKVEQLERHQPHKKKAPVPKPRPRPPKTNKSPEAHPAQTGTDPSKNAPPSAERKQSDGSLNVPIPQRAKYKVRLYPTRVTVPPKPKEYMAISFSEVPTGSGDVEVEMKGRRFTPKMVNSYTYELVPPDLPAGKVRVDIYQGKEKLNTCQLTYENPDVTSFACRNFIVQTLGIQPDDTSVLDQKLLEYFNTTAPEGDLSMVFPSTSAGKEAAATRSDTQLPTLLHFAAHNGLPEFSARLMEMPGALLAYQLLNCNGDDPADLADKANYTDLADYLRNYVETKVTVDMMDDIYVTMKGHSLLYENLRPIVSTTGYKDEGHYAYAFINPTPRKEDDEDDIPESVYLGNRPTEYVPEFLPTRGKRGTVAAIREPSAKAKPVQKAATVPRGLVLGDEIPSSGSVGSRSLEELKQIQIMVAKGKFSIDDAQKLFEAWKNRYGDSPPSFKERQRALEKLRDTFRTTLDTAEESQKLLKSKNRLGSILERVRTTRQKGRTPGPQMNDSRYVTYPVPDDSNECLSDDDDYDYADPEVQRYSGTSSYSSTSGGSRGSRSSVDSSGLGSTGDDCYEDTVLSRKPHPHRQSRRLDAIQDPMRIDVLPPPPVPPRVGGRLTRGRLPSPPSH